MAEAVKVLITGAAGQIAYSLVFGVARGDMLGPNQPVILHLLDIPQMMEGLNGVVMELDDCAFPLLRGVVATADVETAFKDIDYALLVGAMPRREGMERKDLLKANAGIFKQQGAALDHFAKKNVKVVVVGNPANTNALITALSAPSIPRENITALTRLDHNRAQFQIANKANVRVTNVHSVFIWGNHSSTQYPDVNHGYISHNDNTTKTPIRTAITDQQWLNNEFITTVQQRGAAVIKARKLSSAASAAKAIIDHMRDWVLGSSSQIVSMAVFTDGQNYSIPQGLIYSFPVICSNGNWQIVKDLQIDDFSRNLMDLTTKELTEEKNQVLEFLSA
eukprot:TRINITY_DN463_c0_g3_i1.p1 TRINITY_DN463_c0_g3~~TRINITY_DN463_c0_g3_i1.p1  ORF type:complete len:335 (-),score=201.89 TRINITY_DN463_c0_g3_i1:83-1087(-)